MNVWEKRLITAIKKACAANGAQTLYDGQRLCALIESADPELAQQREYKNTLKKKAQNFQEKSLP